MDHCISNISLSVTSVRAERVLWFSEVIALIDRFASPSFPPLGRFLHPRRSGMGLPSHVEKFFVIETCLQLKGPPPGEHLVGLRPLPRPECRYDRLGFLQWRHFHLVTVLRRLAWQVTDSAALVDGSQYAAVHRRLVEAANTESSAMNYPSFYIR